jgi:hypothetical protein
MSPCFIGKILPVQYTDQLVDAAQGKQFLIIVKIQMEIIVVSI